MFFVNVAQRGLVKKTPFHEEKRRIWEIIDIGNKPSPTGKGFIYNPSVILEQVLVCHLPLHKGGLGQMD